MKEFADWPISLVLPVITVGTVVVCLLVAAIFMPLSRVSTMSITAERNALQDSLNQARLNGNKLELAAVINTVANFNRELANKQYYASMPIISWYYSDNVLKTKPVR